MTVLECGGNVVIYYQFDITGMPLSLGGQIGFYAMPTLSES